MTRILGISGSLRRGSYNTALLRAAQALMPEGSTLIEGTIAGIPLYNGDDETVHGIPAPVETLKQQIIDADGLLLFSPEYNNSVPGVLKNAMDWASRPSSDMAKVFGAKPIAVVGATPGGFGTILAQDAWLSVFRTLRTRPWHEGRLMVARAGDLFDETGALTDEKMRDRLAAYLAGFTAFARGEKDR
ncbi:NADPH-dependent FMN reductase [Gymnodinialimonas ceratoperidinii]|uniref:NAD(P)H-dependent oxidoreductase n=1 Tax=Gymnodinialimonas ceratoperidinii TaxID=2856823 RepID=A0A8F6TTK1_9RHOB|nr:NADPH-dependent FMN reductase [Gymnodinialimonas ceratoperidinii]QXT38233.1 NAD(P)H-dependent oxidoreductase [Gymnodinialimonas ceratoperidinii]